MLPRKMQLLYSVIPVIILHWIAHFFEAKLTKRGQV